MTIEDATQDKNSIATRYATWRAARNATNDATYSATFEATYSATFEATYSATGVAFDRAINSEVARDED